MPPAASTTTTTIHPAMQGVTSGLVKATFCWQIVLLPTIIGRWLPAESSICESDHTAASTSGTIFASGVPISLRLEKSLMLKNNSIHGEWADISCSNSLYGQIGRAHV